MRADVKKILKEFANELIRAQRKHGAFPLDAVHASAILNEEAGELEQAALQFSYEGASRQEMRKEAVQVGAMALRFLLSLDELLPFESPKGSPIPEEDLQ